MDLIAEDYHLDARWVPDESIAGMDWSVIWDFLKAWWGYMSCALWTFMGFGVLILNPAATTQKTIYFCLAGVSLFLALIQTLVSQNGELRKLKRIVPEIDLKIEDVVMHRTGDQGSRWKNGEFLVQVSAKLLNLPSTIVEYSAQLVFRGEVVKLTPIKDLDGWEIIERKYYQQQQLYPNSPIPPQGPTRSSFVTNPAAITELLVRSVRNEGWLHFQIEGMGETDIAKRTLRLYVTANGGACYADEELAKHHVVRSDLVAMRRIFD